MVFADFLITHTPHVAKVVFQYVLLSIVLEIPLTPFCSPKLIPWFVSDVTPADYLSILSGDILGQAGASYFSSTSPTEAEISALHTMLSRWQSYHEKGLFSLSVDAQSPLGVPAADDSPGKGPLDGAAFWTTPYSYWKLPEQTELMRQLGESGLVIFKGDLKYVLYCIIFKTLSESGSAVTESERVSRVMCCWNRVLTVRTLG